MSAPSRHRSTQHLYWIVHACIRCAKTASDPLCIINATNAIVVTRPVTLSWLVPLCAIMRLWCCRRSAGVQQPFGWCNRFWKMASTERPIVEHYKLPTASYRDAVWPSLPNPSPLLPCFWNGFNHPDAVGHLLMADVVAYGLVRSLLSSSRNAGGACHARPVPVKFHKGLASMRYCTPPSAPGVNASSSQGTYMTPAQPASFQPLGIAGPWIFREDKPGKPGEFNQSSAACCLSTVFHS